ncbi:hypothetical protein GXP74_34325 [Streptacidiphilus sp. P02-A3a]|nr:hypothetical protein GXP74_34325 [Streptacidiphilus sp. P02-A3a]
MAPGLSRCMYCGDSEGTDIDHFRPIASDPLGTFRWTNHLLACSHCNSNMKRDRYPRDSSGACLLVDPCVDDPHEHLELTFATGGYTPLTAKGVLYAMVRTKDSPGAAVMFGSRVVSALQALHW